MKKRIRLVSLCFILLIQINFAVAYIDPGTGAAVMGSSIIPFLIAVFSAALGFFVKYFWNPIKKGTKKFFNLFKK